MIERFKRVVMGSDSQYRYPGEMFEQYKWSDEERAVVERLLWDNPRWRDDSYYNYGQLEDWLKKGTTVFAQLILQKQNGGVQEIPPLQSSEVVPVLRQLTDEEVPLLVPQLIKLKGCPLQDSRPLERVVHLAKRADQPALRALIKMTEAPLNDKEVGKLEDWGYTRRKVREMNASMIRGSLQRKEKAVFLWLKDSLLQAPMLTEAEVTAIRPWLGKRLSRRINGEQTYSSALLNEVWEEPFVLQVLKWWLISVYELEAKLDLYTPAILEALPEESKYRVLEKQIRQGDKEAMQLFKALPMTRGSWAYAVLMKAGVLSVDELKQASTQVRISTVASLWLDQTIEGFEQLKLVMPTMTAEELDELKDYSNLEGKAYNFSWADDKWAIFLWKEDWVYKLWTRSYEVMVKEALFEFGARDTKQWKMVAEQLELTGWERARAERVLLTQDEIKEKEDREKQEKLAAEEAKLKEEIEKAEGGSDLRWRVTDRCCKLFPETVKLSLKRMKEIGEEPEVLLRLFKWGLITVEELTQRLTVWKELQNAS